jgi:uncharacterized protein
MFGFPSLTKLLVLVAIISAIWFGFRLLGQLDRQRREIARKEKERARAHASTPRQVDDMVKCDICDSFIARGSKACERADCPF